MTRLAASVSVALAVLPGAVPCGAQELSNGAFQILYDESGSRSLRRTNDIHDTDYIAANGRLGPLLVRYRTTKNGDWRELRQMLLTGEEPGRSISYALGTLEPTLASRASAVAQVGAGGLRGLNDGVVPAPSGPGAGRGIGPGPLGSGTADVPLFALSGSRGPSQWVQYTFPTEHEVASAEVFWVRPPKSWRLVYADGGEWKEVTVNGAYGVAADAFSRIEFSPVKTMGMRLIAKVEKDDTVSIAEWRVGPDPKVIEPPDLRLRQTFTLDGNVLDWTIALENVGTRTAEIGDLAIPFNFSERTGARGDIYTKKLLRHAFVAGHGSFVYWQRSNGAGPYLVATPAGDTKFEYFDSSGGMGAGGFGAFTPYVHATVASAAAKAAGGEWRLPISSLTVGPKATVTYAVRFRWAGDFAGVRNVLYEEGKFDTAIVPGMVVPIDLGASIALRTRNRITTGTLRAVWGGWAAGRASENKPYVASARLILLIVSRRRAWTDVSWPSHSRSAPAPFCCLPFCPRSDRHACTSRRI